MSKDNSDFFKEKKEWSIIKDELLACYLMPYMQKILCTRRPLNYIDCFAGKGKFDDNSAGSPIIALRIIKKCMEMSRMENCNIKSYFIEQNYAHELQNNISNYTGVNVISSKYEDAIEKIVEGKERENVFMYIDPFGIKPLKFSLFDNFSKYDFYSIEMLINFNSFGFIREACRALKIVDNCSENVKILYSVFQAIGEPETTSTQELTEIAGGEYWKDIIRDMENHKITCYQAEQKISEQYCQKLREKFKYVINMPIRLKSGQQPKYRMIHVTNSEDGCLLMFENICRRWKYLGDVQTKTLAQSLFEETPENEIIDLDNVKKNVINFLNMHSSYIHLNNFIASFINKYGIVCELKDIQNILKEFEKEGQVEIIRNPEVKKGGKPTDFMTESRYKNQFVELKVVR